MKIPLSLSVYEHAAKIIGRTPWETSRDPDLFFEAHKKAYELYHHFPVVVGIDIYNLEAEAYGCSIQRPDGNGIPSVTRALYSCVDEALALESFDPRQDGRIPMVIEVAKKLKQEFPEADVRVPLSGPFSIAQSLVGLTELVVAVVVEPAKVSRLLGTLVQGQVLFAQAVKTAGLDVAFFESAAAPPLLSPQNFEAIELPALKRIIARVGAIMGHPVPCIIGGDTLKIIPYMLNTGTDFLICPAETNREEFVREMEGFTQVKVRVNLNPEVYTRRSKEEIAAEVDAVVALAAGRKNILLGTGAIPYETPEENILFLKEYAGS